MTAEEYFQKQNGGKPSQDSTDDHEDRTATECVRLMELYATDRLDSYKESLRSAIEKEREVLLKDSSSYTLREARRLDKVLDLLDLVTPKE